MLENKKFVLTLSTYCVHLCKLPTSGRVWLIEGPIPTTKVQSLDSENLEII